MIQPRKLRPFQHERKVLHCNEIITTADRDNNSIVFEPSLWLGFTIELPNSGRQPIIGGYLSLSDVSAETPETGNTPATRLVSVMSIAINYSLSDVGPGVVASVPSRAPLMVPPEWIDSVIWTLATHAAPWRGGFD